MSNVVEIRVVASGAAEAAKVLLAVGDAGAAVGRVIVKGSDDASRGLLKLGDSAKQVFQIFTGVSLANVFVDLIAKTKDFTLETARLGLEAKVQEDAYARFTKSVGVHGDALLSEMQKAAGGILNISDVMTTAVRALQESLQPEQIVRLFEIARQQSKIAGKDVVETFNLMTEAIANQSEKGLKAVRINIDLQGALQAHADALGRDVNALTDAAKAQVFFNEVSAKSQATINALSGSGKTQSEVVQQMAAHWKQLKEDLGKVVVDAGFAVLEWAEKTAAEFKSLGAGLEVFKDTAVGMFKSLKVAAQEAGDILQTVGVPALKDFAEKAGGIALVAIAGLRMQLDNLAASLAFTGSVVSDVAHGKLPDLVQAWSRMDAILARSEESNLKLLQQLVGLASGTTDVSAATKDMAVSTDLGKNKLGDLAAQTRPLIANFDALAKAMRALAQQGANEGLSDSEVRVKALAAGVMEAIASTKGLGPAAVAAFTEYANTAALAAFEAETLKKVQQEDAKIWTELDAAVQKATATLRITGDVEGTLQTKIAATTDALIKARMAFGEQSDAALDFQDRLQELVVTQGELLAHQRELATMMAELPRSLDESTQNVADETEAWKSLNIAWRDATALGKVVGLGIDATSILISTQQQKIALLIREGWDPLGERVKKAVGELDRLKRGAFETTLQDIAIQARLLGPDFDAVAASIAEVKKQMLAAATAAKSDLGPEVVALKAQFDQLVDFQKTRALFQDLFSSVGSAINTLVQGVILGTQTMAQAFKKLGQSIVIDFVNRIIQQALNPLVQAAASVVASLLVGTPAQIAAAAVPGAVGAGTGTGGAGAGGSFAQNFASIARLGGGVVNIFPGITAFPSNFAAGNVSGALLGLEPSTISLGTGEALTVAGTEGLIGASGAVSASFTALSASFAAVGAAIGVFMIAMDDTKTNLGKAIQSATLIGATVIGGVLGGPVGAGVGALVGFAINWIEDMFGLFGKELSHAQREKIELARTTQNVAPLATGLSNVLDAQKLVDLLTQYTSGYIGGTSVAAVMALLHTPEGLLTVGQGGGTAQFPGETISDPARLIKLLTEHPEYLQISVQAGVAQGLLAPLNDAFRDLVLEAVKRIEAIQKAREALTTDIPAQMKKLLPEAIFQDFTTNTLAPLLAQLDSLVASGRSLAELKPEFDALQAQIETLGQVVAVYTQLSNQIASLSGDLTTLTTNAITNAEAGLDLADKAVMEAHVNLLLAIGGPEIIAAAQDLQTAVLARYNLEKQLVAGIEAAIGGLLQAVGKPLMDLQIGLATGPLARMGDTKPLANLLDSLQTLAETSKSTALQLFAVASGIQAIIAGVPAAITGGALTLPETILPSVLAQASPFLAQLTAFTEQARHAGDFQAALALLQQHVGIIQALGQAAIAGVQQWQQQAVAAAQAEAQAEITAIQAAGQAQVTAIQEATAARVEALNAEKAALQEQLALVRQWAQVSKSLGDYLTQLSLGSQAPSNPMVQLDLARSLFAEAYRVFLANPTPGGATDVQQSAADFLAAAQLIYARTSPEYAALFAYITSTLGQVQATAEGLATPEEEMVARLAAIDAELKELQTSSQAQIQAVQDSTTAQVAVVQSASTEEIAAINQTAKDLILEIQTTLEPILAGLATQQDALLSQLLDAQEAILVVITAGKTVTEFMALKAAETVAALDDIRTMLGTFLQGTPPADPALDENAARLAAAGDDLSRAGADLSAAADMLLASADELQSDIQDDQAIQAQLDVNQQTLDAINNLNNAISALTEGIDGLSDGISGLGDPGDSGDGFQHGTPFVARTARYLLHRGEMVLPPAMADIARTAPSRGSGLGSTEPVHIAITINAAPGMDARELAEHVGKVMRREARLGLSNQIRRESR